MRPHIPVIDCHQHLWGLGENPRYPWLLADGGQLTPSYDVSEYLHDMRSLDLIGSVHVEAGWDRGDPCGETAWLAERITATGWPSAAVAYADLAADDVQAVLDRQSSFSFVRGIRMRLAEDHPSLFALQAGDNLMVDPCWLAGFSHLREHKFSFELQVTPRLMPDAATLADTFPDTTIIVSHLGFPMNRSAEGLAGWRSGLGRLAERPNVLVKLSGLAMIDPEMNPRNLSSLVEQAVELFGPSRAMFGTNFPVDAKVVPANAHLERLFEIFRGFSESELHAIFHETAARIYHMQSRSFTGSRAPSVN
ncbi:amidohydrolase family protein [Mesorhizobium sp. BAC0120]|uniref:amidohydrolase family protein n=1 Tax=Mesorhizobium sp. BAC0120 TaxID=3090670 RepID=UPI00298C8265|nr:amidohydrolase family protein [Mesorhizobium sp. BAC0120]MDW6021616.1 amidohydrolase family protein [Mesorhizobium sp. BAC0120]